MRKLENRLKLGVAILGIAGLLNNANANVSASNDNDLLDDSKAVTSEFYQGTLDDSLSEVNDDYKASNSTDNSSTGYVKTSSSATDSYTDSVQPLSESEMIFDAHLDLLKDPENGKSFVRITGYNLPSGRYTVQTTSDITDGESWTDATQYVRNRDAIGTLPFDLELSDNTQFYRIKRMD
ncbi:MAG: hypothetical protein ACMXYG_05600 [Candidatus Woesearchaeota archaeon]